jgi:hypothetical protein
MYKNAQACLYSQTKNNSQKLSISQLDTHIYPYM